MNKVVVREYEEELGEELIEVISIKRKEEILECCKLAGEYASMLPDEYEAIDEHWEEMKRLKEQTNGREVFREYLKRYCGCEVVEITYDYEYEW